MANVEQFPIRVKPKLPKPAARLAEALRVLKHRSRLDDPFPAGSAEDLFRPYVPPKGVLPEGVAPMAFDEQVSISWAAPAVQSYWREGLVWPGYAYLSELTLRPEFRIISQVLATEMTRKWIEIQSTSKKHDGDAEDKTDKINELNEELIRLEVQDRFYQMAEQDGWFGRSHLYVDTGATDDPQELLTSLLDKEAKVTPAKIKKGQLERLQVVEPVWTYPQYYNSTDPLKKTWYKPEQWFVMGKQLHCSRLLTFIGRPVPDILKPAYAFGGLSLSQMCKPYVDNWLQTRQSVNDIIHAFSVMVLMADLSQLMEPAEGDLDLLTRADMFNALRDNKGLFVLDKETEDFKNVSAPLSSLDQLQAQAQEHMASVARIPLVKLLGISPHGLNASSEGELKAFYDTIHSMQETFFRPHLTTVIQMAQLNIWGEVDEDLTFKFHDLWAMTEKEKAEISKMKAETGDILINGSNALHPEEERRRVAGEADSDYDGIDPEDVPEEPDPMEMMGGKLQLTGHQAFEGAESTEPAEPFAGDVRWNESDHPRVSSGEHAGEFTSGGGGSAGSVPHENKYGTKGGPGYVKEIKDPKAAIASLPRIARTEEGAQKYFHLNLKNSDAWEKKYGNKKGIEFYHEVPGNAAESIKKEGIRSDYGTFASIGEPSQFVTSKDKTIVKFTIPRERLSEVGPDMIYTSEHNDIGAYQNALLSAKSVHGDYKGTYVSFPDAVPPEWITGVEYSADKSEDRG